MKKFLIVAFTCASLAVASVVSASASTAASTKANPEVAAAQAFVAKLYRYAAARNGAKICISLTSDYVALFDGATVREKMQNCAKTFKDAWQTTPPPSSYRIMRTILFQGKPLKTIVETKDKDSVTGKWHWSLYFLVKEKGSFKLYDNIDNGPVS